MKPAQLVGPLVVAAEVMGHELSGTAAEAMAVELAAYDPVAVLTALRRCQRELTGRLSLARVLERLPGQHLGADEAWALCPRSEAETVVWTAEISEAYGVAAPLLAEGDQIAARMAFRDAYLRALGRGAKPVWTTSLGHDVAGREPAVRQAVEAGRLSADYARTIGVLPPPRRSTALARPASEDE